MLREVDQRAFCKSLDNRWVRSGAPSHAEVGVRVFGKSLGWTVFALLCAGLFGCDDSEGSPSSPLEPQEDVVAEADADTAETESPDPGLPTGLLRFRMRDFVIGTDITDFQVCIEEPVDLGCEDAVDGVATVRVPSEEAFLARVTAPSVVPHLLMIADVGRILDCEECFTLYDILTRSGVALLQTLVGETLDPARGIVSVALRTPENEGVSGVAVALDGEADALGPIYFTPEGAPDPDAEANFQNAPVGFGNVVPGTRTVRVAEGGTFVPDFFPAYVTDDGEGLRFPVEPDHLTVVTVHLTPATSE